MCNELRYYGCVNIKNFTYPWGKMPRLRGWGQDAPATGVGQDAPATGVGARCPSYGGVHTAFEKYTYFQVVFVRSPAIYRLSS